MKYKTPLFLLIFSFSLLMAKAQDTLTIMQYNLLYYGNTAICDEYVNNTQHKDECIRTILDYVKPDILTVCEFGATQTLQNDFLRHNLNINGSNYWQTDNIINYANSYIINHIFFDSRKLGLKKHVALRTNPRDTDVYELFLKTPNLSAGDTILLTCIVAHTRAGEDWESSRRAQMQIAMNYVDQHYANNNVLIMGDFNMYSANESGYQLLTRTYNNTYALFIDPLASLGGVGDWNNNYTYAPFHTQSTHSSSSGCFSSGGLDDRFDFILMSDEIAFGYNKLRYIRNSYTAVGNDGNHFNQNINQNSNSAVPPQVAEALFDASDHLPVTMKIAVDAHLDVNESEEPIFQASIAPNPATDVATVRFLNPRVGQVQFELYSLQGQLIASRSSSFGTGTQQFELPLQGVTRGFYLLRLSNGEGWSRTLKIVVK
jgi:hypothetical protein